MILGEDYCVDKGIKCPQRSSTCTSYDSTVNPIGLNEFHHGVFRIFHKCLPSQVNYYDENRNQPTETHFLSDLIGATKILNTNYNGVLRGMLKGEIACDTACYSSEVRFFINKNKFYLGT